MKIKTKTQTQNTVSSHLQIGGTLKLVYPLSLYAQSKYYPVTILRKVTPHYAGSVLDLGYQCYLRMSDPDISLRVF